MSLINPMSVQERVHWTLRVYQIGTEVNCIALLFWTLLACDRSTAIVS